MSETKIIFVNIPNEKLQEKLDILERAGITLRSRSVYLSEDSIHFDVRAGAYSCFTCNFTINNPRSKKVNSWREFVFEILKHYYCEVKTSDQADFLHDSTGQGGKAYGDRVYFRHESILDRFGFFSVSCNKEQLTFDGFKLLLNSTKENNMQDKNQQTINLELTPQEVAFLVAFTSSGNGSVKDHLHLKGVHFMDDFIDFGKKSLLWKKLDKSLSSPLGLNDGIYNLDQLEPLFQPEIPLFEFKNGLTTKIDDKTISIGCKTKKPQDWLKYCDQIIELGLDKVEIDGYSFSKVEIDRFRDWLKNNF